MLLPQHVLEMLKNYLEAYFGDERSAVRVVVLPERNLILFTGEQGGSIAVVVTRYELSVQ